MWVERNGAPIADRNGVWHGSRSRKCLSCSTLSDRLTDHRSVEPVQHGAVGAQFFEQAEPVRASLRGSSCM
jgi:hypothetical protein